MPRSRPNDEGGRASRATNRGSSGSNNSNSNSNNNNGGGGGGGSKDYYSTSPRTSNFPSGRNYECKDKDCKKAVAWRNVDNIGGIVPDMMNGNHNSGSGGHSSSQRSTAIIPFYPNQEAREVQMKLLDILAATGLPQADIPTLGARPAGFAALPAGSMAQQLLYNNSGNNGNSNMAWVCAQYDAERDRREWFFHQRRQHLPVVMSEYCEEHTCRYFFTREFCNTKKPRHDALCNTHAFCGVSLCREIKGQVANLNNNSEKSKSMFLRHEFCPKHKCEVDNCQLLRDEVKQGQRGKFCPRHKCYYLGCTKQALDGRGYCVEHGCQSTNCGKIAVVNFMLCKKHLECAERGCAHPRFVVPRDRVLDEKDLTECYIDRYDRDLFHAYYLAYCKDHGLCAEKSCSKLRIKASVHCRKHACLECGCNKPCLTNLKYCVQHKCNLDACMSPKGWKQDAKTREEYCFSHLCRETDCSDAVDNLHIYCELHECQEEPTCIAKVAEDGACIQHFKNKHKKITKAAVRRDTEDTKMAVQRETQQWANTFGVSVGGGSLYGGDLDHRHPLRYFPSSNHSIRSMSGLSKRVSPPSRWHVDRDFDGGDYDEDYDRRDDGRRNRRNNSGGGQGNFHQHTPSSSDAGRSRYLGGNNNDDEDDENESDDYVPVSSPKKQQAPAMASNGASAVPRSHQPQQHQQQQAPGIARPIPQNAARSNAPNAANNGPNYVLAGSRPPAGSTGNEPIIHQRQPSYGGDDNY
ncbi:hypothetical protein Sste5346_004446 [Sporothrix stenoceras]|uniref:Uncharacterized protein n=1 Tax=Sporothrix stenoceras TaxID=5173 RepID=A0ABR3Z823_9PEZI